MNTTNGTSRQDEGHSW